jgi:hypothetical protein
MQKTDTGPEIRTLGSFVHNFLVYLLALSAPIQLKDIIKETRVSFHSIVG